ncbi:MAG: cytochrome d ubiquinol oxidase subunit II [Actinomycetaceae bacterium]|nr:cytochrome d ubiquinol oxidase subunit II [Actinomycetaceae bacterium]
MTFLQVLWFILIAVLWTGYLALEGFSLGAGMFLPLAAKNDRERTQILRTVGPVWDANEVWLLTAGGATFAAFPEWYATMFSGMYFALFVVLLLLIIRISAVEWRAKVASEKWRSVWDKLHTAVAYLVPILLGVAFANLVQGMKIEVVDPAEPLKAVGPTAIDLSKHVHNLTGGFFSLLTVFAVLGGLAVCAIWFAHSAHYLALKTTGDVHTRAVALGKKGSIVAVVLVAVFALWGQFVYSSQPLFSWIPLVLAALLYIAAAYFANVGKEGAAFIVSFAGIAATVAWVFTAMAPNVLKSSVDPAYSLTIAQASSTQPTLIVMTIVAVLLVPVVLGYTAWSYLKFSERISVDSVDDNPGVLWDRIRKNATFLAG